MSNNKSKLNFVNKIKNLEEGEVVIDNNQDFFKEKKLSTEQKQALVETYPIAPINKDKTEKDSPVAGKLADELLHKVDLQEEWFAEEEENYEGQLALDVYQDKKNIYIKAAVAGVDPENIDINLNNDMITIKGKRTNCHENIKEEDYYIKECYWGGFSRSIILPVDIKTDQVQAEIEHGLLTIVLPKSKRPRNTKIAVKEIKK